MISGIINVLKPAGMTSNAVLCEIKKKLRPNKIGHLGTLDPSGTGVLPVCINKATKLFDYYLKKDKQYRAIFVFGKETDTLDSDGIVLNENNKRVLIQDIETVLNMFVGKIMQMPPKYSAKKINGQKAYDLARNNINFNLKPKEIEIYEISVIKEIAFNTFLFDIKCSSGTYIRSLCRDIAYKLNTVAYMGSIIRIKSGNFSIKQSIMIKDITENSIVSLKKILKDKQNVFICDEFYDKILNGCEVKSQSQDIEECVIFCKEQLIGIGHIKNGLAKIDTFLWEKYD